MVLFEWKRIMNGFKAHVHVLWARVQMVMINIFSSTRIVPNSNNACFLRASRCCTIWNTLQNSHAMNLVLLCAWLIFPFDFCVAISNFAEANAECDSEASWICKHYACEFSRGWYIVWCTVTLLCHLSDICIDIHDCDLDITDFVFNVCDYILIQSRFYS